MSSPTDFTPTTNSANPVLSIVVAARNDDHGGNLLGRMQLFVSSLLEQAQRHHLAAELIIVEWNPPPDRPRLPQALTWPAHPGCCTVRIIEVSPELHQRYPHAEALPLFQMIAKNVGIRRAHGQFVLATNIDLLFSDELVQFLASAALEAGYLYRIDRHDVPADVPVDASIETQLAYCRQHVLRTHAREGIFAGDKVPQDKAELWWALTKQFIDQAKPRQSNHKTPSYGNFMTERWHLVRRSVGRIKTLLWPPFPRLHMPASGDFTLMAKADWFALRGYPELPIYSLHIDSAMCYMAHYSGIKEKVLADPMRIYHLEHSGGWTPEAERDRTLYQRFQEIGVPILSYPELKTWILQMQQGQRPIIHNDEQWGLVAEGLKETAPS